jgi:hypothetical protein
MRAVVEYSLTSLEVGFISMPFMIVSPATPP